ncbi:class I SAM-dependent methyltransferase [Hymenobacter aquaticus]|uniref:Class I SAM-dependent methyltransferase n=1 Tax=Hymenobacter aquaticus TaxID=1867101 RepID=A0A4Z0PS93_9BACT|nr:class I SAM-dependent methyltransferase [Hymenobacter aquaticus]TGE20600.1 class I SAM-dependent methyltransferase [Hymenobacter aquaticus]
MHPTYEQAYHQLEEQHWWFVARREAVFNQIQQLNLPPSARILEIGCSGGPLMLALRAAGYQNLHGIDVSEVGIRVAQSRGLTNVAVMDGAHLEFADNSFDLVIASDVLEHIENEQQALSEWRRVLCPKGQLIVFVPAFKSLWSRHDEVNYHFRRYSLPQLRAVVEQSGLGISRASYWNSALFFPAAVMRLAQRTLTSKNKAATDSGDLQILPGFLNGTLLTLLRAENQLFRRFKLPVGISAFVLATKKA